MAKPEAKAKAGAKVEAPAETPANSKKKLFLAMAIAGALGVGVVGGYFYTHKDGGGEVEHKPAKAEPPVFVAIEPFTVNLQPETGDQYLQISFTLQVANLAQVELIKLNMPQVRSRLLLLLSGKKPSEISTPDGKKKLSDEIIASIKQPFGASGPGQNITGVYFTSFIIQ